VIVDTSAVIAILRKEEEGEEFISALDAEMNPKMSVVNYVEVGVVLDSDRNPVLSRKLDEFIRSSGIEVLPVTVEQGMAARMAYRDFGKGTGHPARLNFGDCFAYVLAKERDEPLLFKGNDFSATDVKRV
jgi:ribonuclease VapC